MAEIEFLRHDETVRLDQDRLRYLWFELGAAGAERSVGAVLEELAVQIEAMQRHADAGAARDLTHAAAMIVPIARQVGMTALARVACDVTTCARAGDAVGVAATMARLVRVADRSLTAIWGMQDMRG